MQIRLRRQVLVWLSAYPHTACRGVGKPAFPTPRRSGMGREGVALPEQESDNQVIRIGA
jgi:hypothetical protein